MCFHSLDEILTYIFFSQTQQKSARFEYIAACNKVHVSHFLHDASCLVSLFRVSAKAILCNTAANDLSGTHWWHWHQCSHLMVKVTKLPRVDLYTFMPLHSRCQFLPLRLFQGKWERWVSLGLSWARQSGLCDPTASPSASSASSFSVRTLWKVDGPALYLPGCRPIGEGGEGCAVIGLDFWWGVRCGLEDVGGLGWRPV